MKRQFVLVLSLLAVLGVAFGCGSSNKPSEPGKAVTSGPKGPASPAKVTGQPTTTASGLQYWDTVVGTGTTAIAGNTVKVHYNGYLSTGEKFDSSRDRDQPFSFALATGQVIKGWDEGIQGMKVGGQRQLRVPPDLAYGATGVGNVIPPNAKLVFDVELLQVEK
jgi:FKBP-type peptidyl-prolyl cis-trans isomerase FkpA